MAETPLEFLPRMLAALAASAARAAAGAAISVPPAALSPGGALICVPRLDVGWRLSISKRSHGWLFRFFGGETGDAYVPLQLSLGVGVALQPMGDPLPTSDATWRVELPAFFTPPSSPEMYGIEPEDEEDDPYPIAETVFLTLGAGRQDVLAIHLLTRNGKLRDQPALRYSPGGVPGEHSYEHDDVPLVPLLAVIEELRAAQHVDAGLPVDSGEGVTDDTHNVLREIVRAYGDTARALDGVAPPRNVMLPPSRYGLESFDAQLTMGLDEDAELAGDRDDEVQRIDAHMAISSVRRDARVVVSPSAITGGAAHDAFFSSLAFEGGDPTAPTNQLNAVRKLLGVDDAAAAAAFALSARRDTVIVSTGAKQGLFEKEPVCLVRMRGVLGADPVMLLFAGRFDGYDDNMVWKTRGTRLLAFVRGDDPPPVVDREAAERFFAMLFNSYLWAQRLAR